MFAAAAAAAVAGCFAKPFAVESAWNGEAVSVRKYASEAVAVAVFEGLVGNAAFCPVPLFAAVVGPQGVVEMFSSAAVSAAVPAAVPVAA